jgi:pimeloyl-ACP methyl ester carboxylesterase
VYADINGLRMFYEVRGAAPAGTVPLVLLHGAMSATGTSFGPLPDLLARTRQVVTVEQQGHGRTADIDRPLSVSAMAEDTVAMLTHLRIGRADLLGYSLGAGIAAHILVTEPELARRAVLISVAFDPSGLHPQLLQPPPEPSPESPGGAPGADLRRRFEEEYRMLAPDPDNWSSLVEKLSRMQWPSLAAATIEAIDTPILLIIGDSDIVTPEHAVAVFRLLGGGVLGDLEPMPASRLAILPGTAHVGITERADMLMTMIPPFLDSA